MERALRDFGDKSQSATISLVYCADHGVQVGGKNYLLLVDAHIRKCRDLNYKVIELSTVMAELQSEKEPTSSASTHAVITRSWPSTHLIIALLVLAEG